MQKLQLTSATFRAALELLFTALLTRRHGIETRRAPLALIQQLIQWRLQTCAVAHGIGQQPAITAGARMTHVVTVVVATRELAAADGLAAER